MTTSERPTTMPNDKGPNRRVEMLAKLSADSWEGLQHSLHHLATEIARHGKLSPYSISGGYSAGHILVTSEDDTITHDSWAKELDEYLGNLKAEELAKAAP